MQLSGNKEGLKLLIQAGVDIEPLGDRAPLFAALENGEALR